MPVYEDTNFTLISQSDNTKFMRFDLSTLPTSSETIFKMPAAVTSSLTMVALELLQTFTLAQTFNDAISSQVPVVVELADTGANEVFARVSDINNSKNLLLALPVAGLASNPTITFPDATGTVALLESVQEFTGTDYFTGSVALGRVGVAPGSALAIIDVTSNFTGSLDGTAITADRGWTLPDATGTIALVATSSTIAATYNATGQTANIGSTNLLTAPAAGMYRVTCYLETTAGGVGTNIVTLSWTDDAGAATDATTILALTGVGRKSTVIPAYIASGNLSFATSGYTSGTFALRIRVERL